METHFLENTILFRGVSESEIKEMLTCLGGDVRSFEKGCGGCGAVSRGCSVGKRAY